MNNKKFKLIILCLFVLSIIAASNFTLNAANEFEKIYSNATLDEDFSNERVIVVLNEESSLINKDYTNNDFDKIDCKKVETLVEKNLTLNTANNRNQQNNSFKKVLCLELNKKSKEYVLEVIDILMKRDDILYAGPDYKLRIDNTISNDTYVSDQWAINYLNLPKVWDFSTGSTEVLVGVIDTGIDGTHPDLRNSIKTNLCMDFTGGQQTIVTSPVDPHEHGTHVAGIIGAGNNSIGVIGVNWNIGLVSLRAFDSTGEGFSSDVAKAIEFAENNNIGILNLSASWKQNNSKYDIVLEAIINAYSGLLVCSSGNDYTDLDITPYYPASYNLPNLITVGSHDSSGVKCLDSNYGVNSVDIYAPGASIKSTIPSNSYASFSGTSMATPYVTGVAALLLSINPNLTSSQLKNCILGGADTFTYTTNGGLTETSKKLNAFGALKYTFKSYPSDSYTIFAGSSYDLVDSTNPNSSYFVTKNSFIKLNIMSEISYKFVITSSSSILDISLYDSDLNLVNIDKIFSNNNYSVTFTKMLTSDTYYLKINSTNQSNITVNITDVHTHSYSYSYYNSIYHRYGCDCGIYSLEEHEFSLPLMKFNENISSTFAISIPLTCTKCGYTKL